LKEQYEKPTLSFEYLEKVDVLLSSGGGGGGEDTQQKNKALENVYKDISSFAIKTIAEWFGS
jgi:hypothetical protein